MNARLLACACLLTLFCVPHARAGDTDHSAQEILLQYRVRQDAVAPSAFVAIYPDGMSLGLKIHWKLAPDVQARLSARIAELEAKGPNGRKFVARGRWIHEGYECQITQIREEP